MAVLSAVFPPKACCLANCWRIRPRRAVGTTPDAGQQDKPPADPMAVVDWINMFALAVNERCWRTRGDCAD
ncbi:hypothetical protein ACLB1S_24310 [Escherichia coli]